MTTIEASTDRPVAGDHLNRRGLLRVTAVTGAAAASAGFLAACGNSSSSNPQGSGTGGGQPAASPTVSAGIPLASTGDIPVGGGKVLADKNVVVTQPSSGTFKAFSAVCTHQGCTVGTVANGAIVCPCHGSQFSASDGSVKAGPAQQPLSSVNIKVNGTEITTA